MTPPGRNARECRCGHLEQFSKEPTVPIEFDATLKEYHIVGTNGAQIMIYYCPICGGRTPASLRGEMFMHITRDEMERLIAMTAPLKTLSEVIEAFGPSDWDNPAGWRSTNYDDAGQPNTVYFRTLTYRGLSPTANVLATVHVDDRIQFSFTPKHMTGA